MISCPLMKSRSRTLECFHEFVPLRSTLVSRRDHVVGPSGASVGLESSNILAQAQLFEDARISLLWPVGCRPLPGFLFSDNTPATLSGREMDGIRPGSLPAPARAPRASLLGEEW